VQAVIRQPGRRPFDIFGSKILPATVASVRRVVQYVDFVIDRHTEGKNGRRPLIRHSMRGPQGDPRVAAFERTAAS
jgi:hypothetical protein